MKHGKRPGKFIVRGGKILLVRAGPCNHQTQQHFWGKSFTNDPMNPTDYYKPPVSRGMWAMPFGHDDPFFYSHVYTRQLPKRLRITDKMREELTTEDLRAVYAEVEAWVRANRKRLGLHELWWGDGLWSRLHPGQMDQSNWYWYPSAQDWYLRARREVMCNYRDSKGQYISQMRWSCDHFELFLPGM